MAGTPPDPHEREMDERLRKLLGDEEASASDIPLDLPEVPEDDALQERARELQERARKGTPAKLPDVPDWQYQRPVHMRPEPDDRHNYRGLGVGITVAYALVGCMGAGAFIGWLISRDVGIAFGGLVGSLVGIGFTFYLINRSNGASG